MFVGTRYVLTGKSCKEINAPGVFLADWVVEIAPTR